MGAVINFFGFLIDFEWILGGFGEGFGGFFEGFKGISRLFFAFLSKIAILQKIAFSLGKTYIFQVSNFLKSPKNPIKIDANAERGDKSAKFGVKVDLGVSWAAFGQDLGEVWASKLEPS